MPTFEVDRAWPKVPPQWKLGDPSSIAIDAKDNVWVLHRPRTLKPEQAAMAAPPVIVFDTAGNYIKAWGGAGNGYEWPEREHGIHIDYKGFVWLGGNNCPTNGLPGLKPVADDQLLKFTQDGKFVMQIGRSNQSKGNADTRNLHRPADVWVYPPTNELFVADGYGNHRVAVFDADSGAFKRMWGAFGNKPVDDDHCEVVTPTSFSDPGPAAIQHRARHPRRQGRHGLCGRSGIPARPDVHQGRQIREAAGQERRAFCSRPGLVSRPGQQFLYVGGGNGVFIVDRKTLEIVGNIQPAGMIGAGHQIATDSKGNLYIAQTDRGNAEADVQRDVAGEPVAAAGAAGSNRTIRTVILSRPPASFACATSLVQAASGSGSARSVAAIASLVTISVNPSEHSSRRSPACDLERVRFDVDAGFGAADDVRDDVAEPVLGDLLGLKVSPADHLRHQRVVMRDLVNASSSNMYARLSPTWTTHSCAVEMVRHRHRRAHAAQLRMLRRFLEDASVGLTQRCLELLRTAALRVRPNGRTT